MKSQLADHDDCHTVLCGLRGQKHVYDKPHLKATAAQATTEKVTCMACIALLDGDDGSN